MNPLARSIARSIADEAKRRGIHPSRLVGFVNGQAQAAQDGLADARTGLQAHVGPTVVEEAAQAWLEQAAQLARTRRAVGLIDDALRGRQYVPKL